VIIMTRKRVSKIFLIVFGLTVFKKRFFALLVGASLIVNPSSVQCLSLNISYVAGGTLLTLSVILHVVGSVAFFEAGTPFKKGMKITKDKVNFKNSDSLKKTLWTGLKIIAKSVKKGKSIDEVEVDYYTGGSKFVAIGAVCHTLGLVAAATGGYLLKNGEGKKLKDCDKEQKR